MFYKKRRKGNPTQAGYSACWLPLCICPCDCRLRWLTGDRNGGWNSALWGNKRGEEGTCLMESAAYRPGSYPAYGHRASSWQIRTWAGTTHLVFDPARALGSRPRTSRAYSRARASAREGFNWHLRYNCHTINTVAIHQHDCPCALSCDTHAETHTLASRCASVLRKGRTYHTRAPRSRKYSALLGPGLHWWPTRTPG